MAVNRPVPPRASRAYAPDAAEHPYCDTLGDDAIIMPARPSRWSRTKTIVLTVVVLTISIIVIWLHIVIPWWQGVQNQWQYGDAGITQFDADVGHGGTSHFMAEYYKGAVVVIEIPFAHTNDTHVYTLPGMALNEAKPIIILSTTKDAQTGRQDLIVQVQDTNFQIVLYNTGSTFSQNGG